MSGRLTHCVVDKTKIVWDNGSSGMFCICPTCAACVIWVLLFTRHYTGGRCSSDVRNIFIIEISSLVLRIKSETANISAVDLSGRRTIFERRLPTGKIQSSQLRNPAPASLHKLRHQLACYTYS